jgi:hypothetical protein
MLPFEEGRLIELAYAFEQIARPRRSPSRTPSLVSDVLSYPFALRSPKVTGSLHLDRPTQMLHYDIRVQGVENSDILDIKIHRGSADTKGPAIELLGKDRKGAVPVRNSNLNDLLAGNLHMIIYTRDAPLGTIRGQIQRIEAKGRLEPTN